MKCQLPCVNPQILYICTQRIQKREVHHIYKRRSAGPNHFPGSQSGRFDNGSNFGLQKPFFHQIHFPQEEITQHTLLKMILDVGNSDAFFRVSKSTNLRATCGLLSSGS